MLNTALNNRVPLFLQVANHLKQKLRESQLSTGDKLPTVRALSREFGVSINVIQRAVRELEKEGYITIQHGRGMEISGKEVKTAIPFGFILPFELNSGFAGKIIPAAMSAFNRDSSFLFTDSSNNNPERERELVDHYISNGVAGLIIWPSSDNYNGEYFRNLSKKIPIVLIDRDIPGSELPTIVHDYYDCGRNVVSTILNKEKRSRLLVIMDNLHISSYQDMTSGLESAALDAGRSQDLTILNFPVSRILSSLTDQGEIKDVLSASSQIRRIIEDGEYDAVFCMHDQFIDYVIVQTGISDDIPDLQLACLRARASLIKSIKFIQSNTLEWNYDVGEMVSEAAEMLKGKVLSKKKIPDKKVIKLNLKQ